MEDSRTSAKEVGDYNAFVEGLSLHSIVLTMVRAALSNPDQDKPIRRLDFKTRATSRYDEERKRLYAKVPFSLAVRAKSTAQPFYTLEGEYLITFGAQKNLPAGSEARFEHTLAIPLAYPYIRRLIQDLTSEMGLVPLVAPLLKVIPGRPSEAESGQPSRKRPKPNGSSE
jgi:preprotein translocase subunit SecB